MKVPVAVRLLGAKGPQAEARWEGSVAILPSSTVKLFVVIVICDMKISVCQAEDGRYLDIGISGQKYNLPINCGSSEYLK